MIISMINLDFLGYQAKASMQSAKCNLKQTFYYNDISFNYFFLLNCENLVCPFNKVM